MSARVTRLAALSLGSLFLVTACGAGSGPDVVLSNSTSLPADTTSTTVPADTTAPSTVPTTEATTTTAATTSTTAAPTTTAAPLLPADLVLRSDGIGPIVYGAGAPSVLTVLTPVLGEPTSDTSAEYPNEITPGQFESPDSEFSFTQRFERTFCFANALCTVFGGPTPDTLGFVGWAYRGEAAPSLTTRTGLTVGSRWADFESAMTVSEGGCYSIGYGETEGIELILQSSGTMFGTFDADGNYVVATPDPSEVTVIDMRAGNLPIYLFDDC